jgi:hypothetical protein
MSKSKICQYYKKEISYVKTGLSKANKEYNVYTWGKTRLVYDLLVPLTAIFKFLFYEKEDKINYQPANIRYGTFAACSL